MGKEFGKLTHEQFARLVSGLPEIRSQTHELPKLIASKQSRINEWFGKDACSWGGIYELPFLEQMALLFVLLGLNIPLRAAAQSDDPQEAVLSWLDDNGPLDSWFNLNEKTIEKKYLLWLVIVLQRNILCIMVNHKTMGALVDEVRRGDDSALFKAVQVDRSVLLASPCADRLSRAEMLNDKGFFRHLRSALKGISQKHMPAIQDLRYSIIALRECGFDRFTDQDIERLFIGTRLYPGSAGALKNIRKHIQLARKQSTT